MSGVGASETYCIAWEDGRLDGSPYRTIGNLQGRLSAGSGIDITGSTISVNADNKTIIENTDGELETQIGG